MDEKSKSFDAIVFSDGTDRLIRDTTKFNANQAVVNELRDNYGIELSDLKIDQQGNSYVFYWKTGDNIAVAAVVPYYGKQ